MNDIELKKMVKEILNTHDKKFNNWEMEFLYDMLKKTEYSENMRNKIKKMYEEKI